MIRVVGVEKAVANLQEMSRQLQDAITRKAVRAATRVIQQRVKSTTYGAGRTKRTGLLGSGLSVAVSRQHDRIVGKVVERPVDVSGGGKLARLVRGSTSATTKATAFYWRFLEKGTSTRHTSGGANRGAIASRPWVVPAFDDSADAAIDQFARVFNVETETEARKLNNGGQR